MPLPSREVLEEEPEESESNLSDLLSYWGRVESVFGANGLDLVPHKGCLDAEAELQHYACNSESDNESESETGVN